MSETTDRVTLVFSTHKKRQYLSLLTEEIVRFSDKVVMLAPQEPSLAGVYTWTAANQKVCNLHRLQLIPAIKVLIPIRVRQIFFSFPEQLVALVAFANILLAPQSPDKASVTYRCWVALQVAIDLSQVLKLRFFNKTCLCPSSIQNRGSMALKGLEKMLIASDMYYMKIYSDMSEMYHKS